MKKKLKYEVLESITFVNAEITKHKTKPKTIYNWIWAGKIPYLKAKFSE